MKILLFNPHIDAEHNLIQALRGQSMAVLTPSTVQEAWQMLQFHGVSVSLAVIHREGKDGNGQPGIELIRKIKNDGQQADLPYVLTTEKWGDHECSVHQKTAGGANAYLRWPFSPEDLVGLIGQLFSENAELPEPPTAHTVAVPIQEESEFHDIAEMAPPEGMSPPEALPTAKLEAEPLSVEAITIGESPIAKEEDSGGISLAALIPEKPPEQPPENPEEEASGITLQEPTKQTVQLSVAQAELPDNPDGIDLGESAIPQEFTVAEKVEEKIEESDHIGPPVLSGASISQLAENADHHDPAITASDDEVEVSDEELADQLPYLFQKSEKLPGSPESAEGLALGDAIVPGGAAESPDLETLKKYLTLREQDVIVLSRKNASSVERIKTLEEELRAERAKVAELSATVDDQNVRIARFDDEKLKDMEGIQAEIDELKSQHRAKTEKARLLESKVREMQSEMERLKERVRQDVRKIRVRERELENRLEIVKKDAEALLIARENKIVELKRKLDTLEFNMDILQDRLETEKETSRNLRELLNKAAEAVRVADGLLDVQKEFAELTAGSDHETNVTRPEEEIVAVKRAVS